MIFKIVIAFLLRILRPVPQKLIRDPNRDLDRDTNSIYLRAYNLHALYACITQYRL